MPANLPAKILIIGTLATLLLTAGAQYILFGGEELTVSPLEKLPESYIPSEILIWLDRDKFSEGYSSYFHDGYLYFAARIGERPTGGYAIVLGSPNLEAGEAVVTAEFIRPQPWDMVTHAITYPRTVVRIVCAGKLPATALFMTADGKILARVEVINLDKE